MHRYSLKHLTDSALLHDLKSLVAQDRVTTARLVAHLGEVDARRLYAPAGYPSLFAWCVEELHFSEEAACRRIRAARIARRYPVIFDMLADGRLHLTAVGLLTPHLTPENAQELLSVATHKSRSGIERLLAGRFPQPDLPTLVAPVAAPMPNGKLSARRVPFMAPAPTDAALANSFPSPATVMSKVAPLAPQRFALQCTVSQETHDKLKYAQALLGHSVPTGDLAQVLDRALDALIAKLEQQKFARTERPRPCHRSDEPRHIPASVKRAVWERDGGRCTFVSESGQRCESRTRLEFDHVEPVATGGHATVPGLRLRCRAHNQLAAEEHFGRDFMHAKRERDARPVLPEHALEVIPWLRHLGMRAEEARLYAACCVDMPEASLEERLRHALRCSAPASPRRVA